MKVKVGDKWVNSTSHWEWEILAIDDYVTYRVKEPNKEWEPAASAGTHTPESMWESLINNKWVLSDRNKIERLLLKYEV